MIALSLLLAAGLAAGARAQPLDVSSGSMLVVGDSHTAYDFGRRLDADLRAGLPLWKISVYGSCGSSPHWFFQGLPTTCGLYEHPAGKPAVFLPGGPHPTPLLDSIRTSSDSVVVVALGTNLVVYSTATKTLGWWGMDTVTKMADHITQDYGARCIWVGPPYVRGAPWRNAPGAADLAVRLSAAVREAARGCDYIDSVSVTRPLKHARRPDGIHYKHGPAVEWADEAAGRIEALVQ